ncbi:hypothetical protein D5086_018103 [Populus alba]|uniref:Uncharacterized protein n=1 Tax=Populus alba TaxID=43335 RepID=A0ACC4BNR7_POPAL
MKKSLLLADMKTTWISPKPQTSSSPAGAMATTYTPLQQGTPLYFHDKHFGLHGEILMFVVVGIFFIFLISLVLAPCLKRGMVLPPISPSPNHSSAKPWNCINCASYDLSHKLSQDCK